MQTKLLKLTQGIGKNGKDYYQVTILINNEIVRAFIWQNQFENILNDLSPSEKATIYQYREQKEDRQ